jgi:hypothetical protein
MISACTIFIFEVSCCRFNTLNDKLLYQHPLPTIVVCNFKNDFVGKTETAGYGIHLHLALFNAHHKLMKAILCWLLLKVLRLESSSTSVKCFFVFSW